MSATLFYEDAIDLLDADHKLVQKLFLDFQGLCDNGGPSETKGQLVVKICQDLTVHTQIEEEIFYPRVRAAIDDDALMDEALKEHAEAKEVIARIQGMAPTEDGYDTAVMHLFTTVIDHVMDEREKVFLKARYSVADLRGMVPELHERKKKLQKEVQTKAPTPSSAGKKKVAS
ncbi:hemerythrin domain-containing protein [Aquabacterium sp. A7-Y]|uniref:hemerythrin domain-containing protein n=1 Tax=Aquabacterium sp. A7-Y TaxID=1349605 RepID=UPI00223E167D|nr:hemerythrin domain-containing protein [Aquabacterium sp. A7-Y]MCW7541413.1 hemerythrin domain-containing protein [Aquabacterium sp. A7-Y]